MGNPQPMGDRTMRRIDANPNPYAPLLGTLSWDTSVHMEPGNITSSLTNIPIVPKEMDATVVKTDTNATSREKSKKSLQVRDLYPRLSCLHVISENAVGAGNLDIVNVVFALLDSTMFIAQVTMQECHVMLEKGLSTLDYPLWYPMYAHGDLASVKKRAREIFQPIPGREAPPQLRDKLTATWNDVHATMQCIIVYYSHFLKLAGEITKALLSILSRLELTVNRFLIDGRTIDNFIWIMSTTFGQVDEVFNRVTSPDITADIINVSMIGTLVPNMHIRMESPIDCVHRVIEKLHGLPDFTSDPDLEAELKQRMQGTVTSDKSTSSQRHLSTAPAKKRQPKRPIAKKEVDNKAPDSPPLGDSICTSPGQPKSKRSRTVIKPKRPCIKYLSTAGCTNSNCKFAHRLPIDKSEATRVSSLQFQHDLEASSDMNQATKLVDERQTKPSKASKGTEGGKKQT
jgi:hypothetical protein